MGTFTKVAQVDEIKQGACKAIGINGKEIAIFNLDGNFYAIDSKCTHVGGDLEEGAIDGKEVICPWHGARFDITTGEVTEGPAGTNLACYQVRVDNDNIEIQIT